MTGCAVLIILQLFLHSSHFYDVSIEEQKISITLRLRRCEYAQGALLHRQREHNVPLIFFLSLRTSPYVALQMWSSLCCHTQKLSNSSLIIPAYGGLASTKHPYVQNVQADTRLHLQALSSLKPLLQKTLACPSVDFSSSSSLTSTFSGGIFLYWTTGRLENEKSCIFTTIEPVECLCVRLCGGVFFLST